MARASSILCVTHFILVQTVFANVIKDKSRSFADNITDHGASGLSDTFGNFMSSTGRHKRSLYDQMPMKLTLRIKFPTGQEVDLKWIRSKSYLANEHLPVITLIADLHPNIMYDFGEFVTYHDKDLCSAIVYFEKLNLFYGVIGINYYIEGLPYIFNEEGEYQLGTVGKPYVIGNEHSFHHIQPGIIPPPLSDKDAWIDYFRSPGYNSDHERKRQSDCHQDHGENSNAKKRKLHLVNKGHWSRQDPGIYLEILLFITQDIVDIFKENWPEDYFHWIIRYHIIYFNAVEMMFKNLRNEHVGIHINIAKIVIEDALLLPFDFMSNGDNPQFSDIVDKLPQYLYRHQLEYPPDSFDHVFIHTGRTIMDGIVPIQGLSRYGKDLYSSRKANKFYEAVPITVVQMKKGYADYLITLHEIGRTFGLEITPSTRGLNAEGQCESIMQREGPKCKNCLSWSYENAAQFEKFRRQNRNICFLMNKPRSLRHPGPSVFLRPQRQCQCFGYDSHKRGENNRVLNMIRVHECSIPLSCKNLDLMQYLESTVRPFDGTPCANKKVCWNGQCMKVTQ